MKNFATDALQLGIVGAGAMGRGIAQIAATAGIEVRLFDLNGAAAQEAVDFARNMLCRAQQKGRLSAEQAERGCDCLRTADSLQALADADLIVEAIVERLDVKQQLFQQLESLVSPECILATNTSSLSVTAIAATLTRPERLAGYHFFNPVPLMKLVEVIGGLRSAAPVLEQLTALAERMGHTPVRVADMPGFLVNHLGRGLVTEGARILQESVTTPAVLDAVMRDCAGFRMGPCELMDLTGLDVTFPASEQIYNGFFHEPRLRPAPLMRARRDAGLLGRKSGAGFYDYRDGAEVPEVHTLTDVTLDRPVWISRAKPQLHEALKTLLADAQLSLDEGEQPGKNSLLLVTPLGEDCTGCAVSERLDPARTVAVDALFTGAQRITLMTNPATSAETLAQAVALFGQTGRAVSVLRDSPGFAAQRIWACIINLCCDIAQQGIAEPQAIDLGAQLGLGYPQGPLALGDQLGASTVLTLLDNLQAVTGDPRYRPSLWLRRRAALGLSLSQAELISSR